MSYSLSRSPSLSPGSDLGLNMLGTHPANGQGAAMAPFGSMIKLKKRRDEKRFFSIKTDLEGYPLQYFV